jgi:hypothetical protein
VSGSLTVLKIDKLREVFKKEKNFTLKENSNLDDYDLGYPELGFPITDIKFVEKDPNYYHFDVKFFTDTKDKTIYVYGEGLEDYYHKYQEIEFFKFRLNTDFTKIYIFVSRKIAEPFQKRLEKMKYLDGTNIIFDFSRLEELPNFVSGYGLWKNSQGIVKKAGEFGHGIESTINDFSVITTFYIDYMYNDRQVQLILNKEGRISTNTNLESEDLLNLYNEIENTLAT